MNQVLPEAQYCGVVDGHVEFLHMHYIRRCHLDPVHYLANTVPVHFLKNSL